MIHFDCGKEIHCPIYVCFVSRLGGPAFHHYWYQVFWMGGLDTDALLWVEDLLIHSQEAGGLLTLGSRALNVICCAGTLREPLRIGKKR